MRFEASARNDPPWGLLIGFTKSIQINSYLDQCCAQKKKSDWASRPLRLRASVRIYQRRVPGKSDVVGTIQRLRNHISHVTHQ